MRLDFVVPRYGREVIGGAEAAVRMLAERLVSSLGWDVRVLTTCARDSRTWANEFAPGSSVEGGVRVERFVSEAGRDKGFDKLAFTVLYGPNPSFEDQVRLIDLQGPVSSGLLDAATSSDAELVAFTPYLYHPVVYGVPRLGRRAVVHPAAHDEPVFRLDVVEPVFQSAGGFAYYTHAERQLVERRFDVGHVPGVVVGLGVDAPESPPDASAARRALGLDDDEPFLLCVGRVDEGKGARLLAESFAAYKERRPGPLKLVFIGQVVDRPAERADVVVAGMVDDAVKWGAYAAASALVQPSPNESFSLVLIEAWLAGAPVLVNAACPATWEHAVRSGGGLRFGSYPEFEVAVDRLVGDEGLRRRLAERGRAYAEGEFSWAAVLDRYARFMSSCGMRAGR